MGNTATIVDWLATSAGPLALVDGVWDKAEAFLNVS